MRPAMNRILGRLILSTSLVGLCPTGVDAQDDLLNKAKANFAKRLVSTPNFTCVLEIERSVYPTPTFPRAQSQDRYRVEVGVIDGKEHFAWPGEPFENLTLPDLLGPGLASSGEFSSHGRAVFQDRRTAITRAAEGDLSTRLPWKRAATS